MRLLALLTDAYGGRGGIAAFNRHLLEALCTHPQCGEVVALPRVMPEAADPGSYPPELTYRTEAAAGKLHYALTLVRSVLGAWSSRKGGRYVPFDAVVCGHINLLPLARLAAWCVRAPVLLIGHGIDVWEPTERRVSNALARRVDAFVAVSAHTRQRFLSWSGLGAHKASVVPNCIEADRFGHGPKPPSLITRYGLQERTVLMTLSRLSASEQYKGHDEVLEALPALVEEHPALSYLVCGDGDDRARLEEKARRLGLADRVIFAGYVPEAEKAAHYRLADAFVMPGRGEGFGIVYLEALACGVPVVASSADASREAVRGGELGAVVDPDDPDDLRRGIRQALARGRGPVPDGLDYFSKARFVARWHETVTRAFVEAA